jgi:phenylpyruvate tautomerase PptA (4-oxalocrotonate tautomerase family)
MALIWQSILLIKLKYMPLVRIDIIEGWSDESIRQLSDTVQDVMISHFAAPVRDKYQVIHEHKPGRILALDTGLGFERTSRIVIIQITQQGRTAAQKQLMYAEMCLRLEGIGIAGTDLIISVVENTPADWSFGIGRAQFLTGELASKRDS